MSATDVPPGFSPPLHPIATDDHGGYVAIATGCGLVFVLMFAVVRLLNLRRVGLHLSDFALLAATVLTVLQSTIVLVAVDDGLGKMQTLLSSSSVKSTAMMLYTSHILYVLALFLSKISLLCLIWRISVERAHIVLVQWTIALTVAGTVASLLMVAVGCEVQHPWKQVVDVCQSIYTRWIVVETLGLTAELAIFALIARIYRGLQRRWQWKVQKLGVFGLRIGMVPFAILRLLSLRDTSDSRNPFFDRVPAAAWTQGALAYSIATATIPSLMAVMSAMNTGWGALNPATVRQQTRNDSSLRTAERHELQTIQAGRRTQPGTDTRADDASYKWAVHSRPAEARSVASDDSKNFIIKKTVEFSSRAENA